MAAKKAAKKKARKRTAKKSATLAAPKPGMVRLPVPTIGRIVIFNANGVESPAIITEGNDDPRGSISIMILGKEGSHRADNVPHSDESHSGCWSWPPFVAPKEVEA